MMAKPAIVYVEHENEISNEVLEFLAKVKPNMSKIVCFFNLSNVPVELKD
jgi:uncharacterized membrane protein